MDRKAAAIELLRRKRCRTSLHSYALNIDIPTSPLPAMHPDEDVLGPAADLMAKHHAVMLSAIQNCMDKPFGRLMMFLPPGSAKSLYVDAVATSWEMGRKPGSRIILTSYQTPLAERQSRRAMQIVQSADYQMLWDQPCPITKDAAGDWMMANGSNMLAMGLTAGVTGNRANGAIVDDPTSGREDADSPTMQQNVRDAFQDDLLTRLLPGAWMIIIMTRWSASDLAGSLLPDDYAGQSGPISCKDGMRWEILNIPAKAERSDDPLGRKPGEYMWPEWFPPQHWAMYENNPTPEGQRSWASLYQQRPSTGGAGHFNHDMFKLYEPRELPERLTFYGAGDYAITQGGGDFTELGVWGVDAAHNLWFVDWWNGQVTPDVWADKTIEMASKWKCVTWYSEAGVIDKTARPLITLRQRQLRKYFKLDGLPSNRDKITKLQAFQGRAAAGCVYMPKSAQWSQRVIQQLIDMPGGRHDDAADVCGLAGRAISKFGAPAPLVDRTHSGIRPFSAQWLEHVEKEQGQGKRYR